MAKVKEKSVKLPFKIWERVMTLKARLEEEKGVSYSVGHVVKLLLDQNELLNNKKEAK